MVLLLVLLLRCGKEFRSLHIFGFEGRLNYAEWFAREQEFRLHNTLGWRLWIDLAYGQILFKKRACFETFHFQNVSDASAHLVFSQLLVFCWSLTSLTIGQKPAIKKYIIICINKIQYPKNRGMRSRDFSNVFTTLINELNKR